jgi:ribosome-binding factor A
MAGRDPAIRVFGPVRFGEDASPARGRASKVRFMSRQHKRATSGPSQRALRAGELVRHAVADILARGEVHDPVIETHLITVPEVRLSPDLRLATIYVVPLRGQDEQKVLEALEHNRRFLRGEIAQRVNLKFAPDIRFRIDERFAEAERIDKLLRSPDVQRDLDSKQDDQ